MPRASGGGSYHSSSHSGGSHSHSSSHSGGSHYSSSSTSSHSGGSHSYSKPAPPPPRREYKPFKGAKRYRRVHHNPHDHHQPEYIYANYDITERKSIFRFLWLFLYIPAIIIGIFMVISAFDGFQPINKDHYEIIIDDNINVITNKDDLYSAMEDFQKLTDITPCLLTVNDQAWSSYNSLVDYAYDVYVDTWGDENHWLFVYSQDSTGYDWEGMQGDDTTDLVSEKYLKAFNKIVNTNLKNGKSIDVALTIAFSSVDIASYYPPIDFWSLIIGIIWTLGFSFACYFFVIYDENKEYRNYIAD